MGISGDDWGLMNHYATSADVRQALGDDDTDLDARYFKIIASASRSIDLHCQREFFVETASKRFNTPREQRPLFFPDLLSASLVEQDLDRDQTFGDTVVAADYLLFPLNDLPKTHITRSELSTGLFLTIPGQANIRITGDWGYGNGRDASPVTLTAITVTIADETEIEVDVDTEGTIDAGDTILVGTERLFVLAASSNGDKTLTVQRGVNGSTAASATGLASVYQYPAQVTEAALRATLRQIGIDAGGTGTVSQKIGQFSESLLSGNVPNAYKNGLHEDERGMLDGLRRISTI